MQGLRRWGMSEGAIGEGTEPLALRIPPINVQKPQMVARFADNSPPSWHARRAKAPETLRPLAQILQRVIRSDGVPTEGWHAEMQRAWSEIVPEAFRGLTRVAGVRRRCVVVEVASAAALHELAQFHADALRRALSRALGGRYIERIAFVLNDRRSRHDED